MNKTILNTLAALVFAAAPLMAVPSGINYQGALTDDQGNPITGTRMMSIKLYTAATDGTLLYSEDIGEVDVSDGVFSFEFGTSGSSNAQQTDTVAITDGTATTFQKVLSASEVVAGSVSVTDGTYTWSQSGGSSNEDEFGVAYSTSLRRVTVTYYNGAPAAGRTITATYRTPASGISGALAGDNQPWAEITVDGVAQIPRQKVLTVPFALMAGELSNSSTEAITSAVRRELSTVYEVLAAVMSGGLSSYRATWTPSSQGEIFDDSDGLFNSMLENTSTATTQGVELNKRVVLDSRPSSSTSNFPNPATYTINDKIRYVDSDAGGWLGGFTVTYDFNYSDNTTSRVTSDASWAYSFRISNPHPGKTVTSLTRTSSRTKSGYFYEAYRSLSPVEVTIQLNTALSSGTAFLAGYSLNPIGGGISQATYELLNSRGAVLAASTSGYLALSGSVSDLRLRIRLEPELTNSAQETSILEGVTITSLPSNRY